MCVCVRAVVPTPPGLTASVCELSHGQAVQSHGSLEGVCAALHPREGQVAHRPAGQHQDVVEEEEAQVGHLLVAPDGSHVGLTQTGLVWLPGQRLLVT